MNTCEWGVGSDQISPCCLGMNFFLPFFLHTFLSFGFFYIHNWFLFLKILGTTHISLSRIGNNSYSSVQLRDMRGRSKITLPFMDIDASEERRITI